MQKTVVPVPGQMYGPAVRGDPVSLPLPWQLGGSGVNVYHAVHHAVHVLGFAGWFQHHEALEQDLPGIAVVADLSGTVLSSA